MEYQTTATLDQKWYRYIEWGILVCGIVLAIIASTYKLSEAPATWFDEGIYMQAAMNLAEHGAQTLQVAPNTFISNPYLTVGYTLLYPVSLSFKLFGTGVLQGRVVMVLYMFAFLAAAYALACMLFGRWQASWALLLLSSFPILYGDGKVVLGEVPGMFFLLLTAIALVRLERSNYQSAWSYIAAGFAAGLCVVTKPIFIVLLPALAVTWIIRRKSIRVHWGGVALAVVAFALPVALWADIQFGGGGLLSKQLEYYLASPYPTSDKLGRAITNFKQFFTETTPIYTAGTIVLWCVSLVLRKKRGVAVASAEIALLTFCFFILAAYLRIEGWYRYFFPAEIAALIFVPYAVTNIFEYVAAKNIWLKKAVWLPYAFVLLLVLVQSYQLARSSYVAQYYGSTNTADTQKALGALGAQSSFFLADAPELAILLPSRNYYQYIDAAPDLRLGADQVPLLQSGVPDYVLLLPELYQSDPGLFSHYATKSQVGKYLLLAKRT